MAIYFSPGEAGAAGAVGAAGATPPDNAALAASVTRLTQTVEALAARNQQFEALFVNPDFLEFVDKRTRGGGGAGGRGTGSASGSGASGSGARGAETTQDQTLEQIDDDTFNNLSPKQQSAIVVRTVMQAVRENVEPRLSKQEVQAATEEVQVAAGKYEDFWEYRAPMLKLSQQHPTLSAAKLYLLAVDEAGKQPKPRVAAAAGEAGDKGGGAGGGGGKGGTTRSEAPGGVGGAREKGGAGEAAADRRTRQDTKFTQAFGQAWKDSGLKS